MKNYPEITVVMPVFNTVAYLDSAVESVLCQTFGNFELLAINDGSTDGSLYRLEQWASKDPRMRVLSQENRGASAARNVGISQAKGNFIYFMDSDDILNRDALGTCYEYCRRDQVDFVFFDAETLNDGTFDSALVDKFNYKRTGIESMIMPGRATFEKLLKSSKFFSPVWLLFIDLNFLRKIGLTFNENIVHEDDLFTSLLFLEAQKARYIPASFFIRRLRVGSFMMVPYSMKNIHSYFVMGTKLLEYAKKNSNVREIIDLYLKEMIDAAVWKAYDMSLKKRTYILMICLRRWRKYVKIKTLFALLFKKYIRS
ncbi:glycosyltransferase [Sphingobacterium sp.]|uniref:glycosyltransferase n=1 Tax=Sphingobacterium sp. TaxID=341027 RepID=UPI0028A25497|nr:glycosyltransferase [Sphingobacterium sp.]